MAEFDDSGETSSGVDDFVVKVQNVEERMIQRLGVLGKGVTKAERSWHMRC